MAAADGDRPLEDELIEAIQVVDQCVPASSLRCSYKIDVVSKALVGGILQCVVNENVRPGYIRLSESYISMF